MKDVAKKLLSIGGLVVMFGVVHHVAQANNNDERAEDSERQRINVGFRISPVPVDLSHNDRRMVGLGSYLVNAAGGCNDCHTNPSYKVGNDPFLGQPKMVNTEGYLTGGQHFGPFVSRNLRPENGRPAGRTYPEFVQIMRTGADLDHAHPQLGPLLQVMPWPAYQSLTDRDLRAIYEYLRAIPPAPPVHD